MGNSQKVLMGWKFVRDVACGVQSVLSCVESSTSHCVSVWRLIRGVRCPRWLSWNGADLETESERDMDEWQWWDVLAWRLVAEQFAETAIDITRGDDS